MSLPNRMKHYIAMVPELLLMGSYQWTNNVQAGAPSHEHRDV
jgi:hypothetical protein